ncbi:MAG: carbohydrate porin, partial [Gammaproteobacteria bacterium]|nr:carbohydrate porin [Gammaproteobacteria bacterium]
SRPVLRFFVTLADWSDDLKGLIGNIPGNAPYADETQGWTIGAQAEAWW